MTVAAQQPEFSGSKGRLDLQPSFTPSLVEQQLSPDVGKTTASIQEDVSEAHSAVDSPSTVDPDIKQPTETVNEAAKQAAKYPLVSGPDGEGEIDYYEFPKNWEEEPTMESHDKLQLLKSIRPGDRVTILVPAGRGRNGQEWTERSGRAVIVSEGHVALNMGGAHGTPGVATVENLVSVRHAKRGAEKVAQELVAGT